MSVLLGMIGLLAIILLVWQLGREPNKTVREGISATQALLTVVIAFIGFNWYFRQRPDAARVDVSLAAATYPLAYPNVLVRGVFTLKNSGRAAMPLDKGQYVTFWAERVSPFDPEAIASQLAGPEPEGAPRVIKRPRFKTIRQDRLNLENMLETGETDSIVYYAIFDCRLESRIVLRATMDKPAQSYETVLERFHVTPPNAAREAQLWSADTLLDLHDACLSAEKKARS